MRRCSYNVHDRYFSVGTHLHAGLQTDSNITHLLLLVRRCACCSRRSPTTTAMALISRFSRNPPLRHGTLRSSRRRPPLGLITTNSGAHLQRMEDRNLEVKSLGPHIQSYQSHVQFSTLYDMASRLGEWVYCCCSSKLRAPLERFYRKTETARDRKRRRQTSHLRALAKGEGSSLLLVVPGEGSVITLYCRSSKCIIYYIGD